MKSLYVSELKKVKKIPFSFKGSMWTKAIPKKGVFEYIKPEYNPKTQTLGHVEVINDVATNKIIEHPNWELIDKPIRITVRDKLLKSEKKFSSLAFDLLIDNPNSFKSVVDNKKYTTVYISYVSLNDGFALLEDKTIQPPDADLLVEQIDKDFHIIDFDEQQIISHV